MTSVIFLRDRTAGFVGFRISGHSGYADAGSDIVCSAVSACCELVLNQLCDSFGCRVGVKIDPENADVECDARSVTDTQSRYVADKVLDGFYRTVSDMQKEYPRFVQCSITEV